MSLACVTALLSFHLISCSDGDHAIMHGLESDANITARPATHVRRPASRISVQTHRLMVKPFPKTHLESENVFEKDLNEEPEWPGCPHGVDPSKKSCFSPSKKSASSHKSPTTQMKMLRQTHKGAVITPDDSAKQQRIPSSASKTG